MRMDSSRHLGELDVLRVLAVLLVVLGHAGGTGWEQDGGRLVLQEAGSQAGFFAGYVVLIQWLYGYHMYLFMALSGACYFLSEGHYASLGRLLRRKLQRLMLPCFAAGLLVMLPLKYVAGFYSLDGMVQEAGRFLLGQEGFGHLWFLPALFWVFFLFWLGRRLFADCWTLHLLLAAVPYVLGYDVLLGWLGTRGYCLSYGLYFWFWFVAGYLFQKYDTARFLRRRPGRWTLVWLLISVGGFWLQLLNPFAMVVTGCLMVYSLAALLEQGGILTQKWFQVLLQFNFSIYLFHDPLNYLVVFFANQGHWLLSSVGLAVYILLRVVGVAAVSAALGWLVQAVRRGVCCKFCGDMRK